MKRVRRSFTAEFKQEAVRQATELGLPASQVARELDLGPEQLRHWKQGLVRSGTVSPHLRQETQEELRRLRRELAVLRQGCR